MGICAAESERADAGSTQSAIPARPGRRLSWNVKRHGFEADMRVQSPVVQARRDLPVTQYLNGLDETGDAGSGFEVPDVGLDRVVFAGFVWFVFFVVFGFLCVLFFGVAQRCSGSMGLDEADILGTNAGIGQSRTDRSLLRGAVGCGETIAATVLT